MQSFDYLTFGGIYFKAPSVCGGAKRLPIVCTSAVKKTLDVGGWSNFSLTASSISDSRLDQQLSLCVSLNSLVQERQTVCLCQ